MAEITRLTVLSFRASCYRIASLVLMTTSWLGPCFQWTVEPRCMDSLMCRRLTCGMALILVCLLGATK